MPSANPIIVVTGANGGVGFGICQRLLVQLSSGKPSDAEPQLGLLSPENGDEKLSSSVQGLTLIMACRSTKRAEVARTKLYSHLDAHIEHQKKLPGYDGHADTFRSNLKIEIQYLDLAIIQSILRFGVALSQQYAYVSHLICNAGVASFTCIDWPKAIRQLCTDPVTGVTAPTYYLQNQGELSVDGLGWVWQCNVFGHFCLFRTLQPLLLASKSTLGARVIWMSSIEASPAFYDSDDWQLIKTKHSYESSKYQIDIIATNLDRRAIEEIPQGSAVKVRHVVVQPGIAATNISNALTGSILDLIKLLTFYIARMFNSPHHTIQPYKAAIAAVHLSLISLSFIPAFELPSSSKPTANGFTAKPQPVRFGSETDRWGTERVGITPVKQWEEHAEEGDQLLKNCDELYEAFVASEGTLQN